MRRHFQLGMLSALAFFMASSQADAAAYKVDPGKSQLVVQVFKDGVAASLAHDHVVQATQLSGTVNFDPAAPGGDSISVEVKTQSLKADEPALRKKYGLPGELSASDRADIEKNMKDAGQLDVAKFQTITFQSTSIQKQADGKYTVTGKLTIKGKTQTVTFPATVAMEGPNFHGKGQIKFNTSSFGIDPYSALFGAIKNKDGVILNIDIIATP